MVACITISTSSAYAFGEVSRQPHSLNLPMSQGKAFYGVLFLEAVAASGLVLIPGLPLVSVVLVVNVIAVLAMPPALIFLFMLVNDREIMGDFTSPRWANVLATIVVTSAGRRGNTLRDQRHRAQPVRADRREIACLKSQSRMPIPQAPKTPHG